MSSFYLDKGTYSLNLIDKKNWTRLTVTIEDNESNKYPIDEIVQNLLKYIEQETKKEKSSIVSQIYPVMSQLMIPILLNLGGESLTQMLVGGEIIKNAILDSMTVSFLFLKYIQQKELKIISSSEVLTSQEIEFIKRHTEEVSQSSPITQLLGVPPAELLKSLYQNGDISKEELNSLINNQNNS
jgi:hypothetical protein